MTKFVLYPLAAFGAYTVAALATTRWWIRHAELNELLGQISDTPAPPVRPEIIDELRRQQQAKADRHHYELERRRCHNRKADR